MSEALPKTADAIVIGGGIVGSAIARQLAKDGLKTVLLEAQAFGGAVSGASLACLGTHMHNLDELYILKEACALLRGLSEELGNSFEYNQSGQLRFILKPEDVAQRFQIVHIVQRVAAADGRVDAKIQLEIAEIAFDQSNVRSFRQSIAGFDEHRLADVETDDLVDELG